MGVNEIYNLILLVGGVLMFIMSFVLWFSPKGLFPNRILAALIFSWAICVLIFATQSRQMFLKFPHLLGVGSTITFLFFPLMYVYIKSYLYRNHRKIVKYTIHIVPLLLFIGMLSPFYFQSREAKIQLIKTGLPESFYMTIDFSTVAVIVLGVLYTVLSYRLIVDFEDKNLQSLNEGQIKILSWLKQFLAINIIFWAIGTTGSFIEFIGLKNPLDLFKIYYLGLTLLTLRVGVINVFNQDFYKLDKEIAPDFTKNSEVLLKNNFDTDDTNEVVLRKVISNSESDKNDVQIILNYLEEHKPYLNSNMSLPDLSNQLGMTRHRVSDLLNTNLGFSFTDIINEYRVKEVLRLLDEGKHHQHTLVYLAELAGFNSKATFNRIFKKSTGKTPTQYIQELPAA